MDGVCAGVGRAEQRQGTQLGLHRGPHERWRGLTRAVTADRETVYIQCVLELAEFASELGVRGQGRFEVEGKK